MTTTMKQGIILLLPKPGKDADCIDNWRPISLLTIDYKILALVYANRRKTGLGDIISETQSQALLLFLEFYKAFDTIKHAFI